MKRVVIAGWAIGYPEGGGLQWIGLQYAAGLRALGVEVFWVDQLNSHRTNERNTTPEAMIEQFRPQFDRFGIGDRWCVLYEDKTGAGRPRQLFHATEQELRARCADCDLLLNLSGHLQDDDLLRRIRRRAYVDLDPGFTQIWAQQVNMGLQTHNLFFSVGLNVGRPGFAIPTGGVEWHTFPPPVSLDHWPVVERPPSRPFTTVAQWRGENAVWENEYYGPKREEFLRFIEMPRRTKHPLELALLIHPNETDDLGLLRGNGWTLTDPHRVAHGIEGFQRYVQESLGEFSVAKSGYVKAQSGWFSDRTACYLASGRPALVQDTGFSRHLPTGEGLLAFRTIEEAVAGLDAIMRDYAKHAAAARKLAGDMCAAPKVVHSILERAGVSV
jgi:hypothetical protein